MAYKALADEVQRDNPEAFRLLVEAVEDYAIFLLDDAGKVVSWNRGAQRIKRYAAHEIIGRHFSVFYLPEAIATGWPDKELTLAAREGRFEDEGWRVRKDGTTFWANVVITALRDPSGALTGYAKVTRDLTERRRAEQALQQANAELETRVRERTAELERANAEIARKEEYLRVTMSSIGDAVIATGINTEITLMNEVAQSITGWTLEEAAGVPLAQVFRIVNEFTRRPAPNPAVRAIHQGIVVGLANHTLLLSKDGREIPIDDSAAPIRDTDGRMIGCVLTFRDVTEHRNAERVLREAEKRKDEFLAVLAHELRNPLSPIRNAVQILKASGTPDPEAQWAREVIQRQVGQMGRLLDDLLDVSRIAQNKLEPRFEWVDIAAVIQTAVEASRPLIDEYGHTLTITLSQKAIWLNADAVRLAQVFTNLLNNAAKYTERGGRIDLAAGKINERLVVSVKDNGIGIPAEFLPALFELFSQQKSALRHSGGGLGIGLSLARRLVELHGGHIRAVSEGPGKGSEFVVTLPIGDYRVAQSMRSDAVARPGKAVERPVKTLRVLVVDDNRDAAETMAMMLEHEGHEVRFETDGEAAIATAADFNPHAAILDIGLPQVDGYEVARRIRSEPWGKQMMLIAMTGWGKEEDKRQARDAGFDHHFTKPAELTALSRLLSEHNPHR
jgi:PAS domain S-box-containing protein